MTLSNSLPSRLIDGFRKRLFAAIKSPLQAGLHLRYDFEDLLPCMYHETFVFGKISDAIYVSAKRCDGTNFCQQKRVAADKQDHQTYGYNIS